MISYNTNYYELHEKIKFYTIHEKILLALTGILFVTISIAQKNSTLRKRIVSGMYYFKQLMAI